MSLIGGRGHVDRPYVRQRGLLIPIHIARPRVRDICSFLSSALLNLKALYRKIFTIGTAQVLFCQ